MMNFNIALKGIISTVLCIHHSGANIDRKFNIARLYCSLYCNCGEGFGHEQFDERKKHPKNTTVLLMRRQIAFPKYVPSAQLNKPEIDLFLHPTKRQERTLQLAGSIVFLL